MKEGEGSKGKGKKMEINMNVSVEKYGERVCREIVEMLSVKYGFSKSEAEEYLKVSKKVENRGYIVRRQGDRSWQIQST